MIEHFEVSAVHTSVDEKLQKYLIRKLAALDKFMPKAHRSNARMEVRLKEEKALKNQSHKNQFSCEVTLHLPHGLIHVAETTMNLYAAVDIVEAKLKQRIIAYKQLHAVGMLERRSANRAAKRSAV